MQGFLNTWLFARINMVLTQQRTFDKPLTSLLVGTFIAFSPFIGFHTIMVLLVTWLFKLNFLLVCVAAYGINNPWTMVPIYAFEYMVGYVIVHRWLGIAVQASNPAWMERLNTMIQRVVPLQELSFWAFMVGGHLVALISTISMYGIYRRFMAPLTPRGV